MILSRKKTFNLSLLFYLKSLRKNKFPFVIFFSMLVFCIILFFESSIEKFINTYFLLLPLVVLSFTSEFIYEEIHSISIENLFFLKINKNLYLLFKNIVIIIFGIFLWVLGIIFSSLFYQVHFHFFVSLSNIVYYSFLGILLGYKIKGISSFLIVFSIGILVNILVLSTFDPNFIEQISNFSSINSGLLFICLGVTFPGIIWKNLMVIPIHIISSTFILLLQVLVLKHDIKS